MKSWKPHPLTRLLPPSQRNFKVARWIRGLTFERDRLRAALLRYAIHEPDCLAIPRPDNLGEVGCTCGLSAALGDSDDDYIEFQPVQPVERVEVTMHKPDNMTNDEFRAALQEAVDEAEEG